MYEMPKLYTNNNQTMNLLTLGSFFIIIKL